MVQPDFLPSEGVAKLPSVSLGVGVGLPFKADLCRGGLCENQSGLLLISVCCGSRD